MKDNKWKEKTEVATGINIVKQSSRNFKEGEPGHVTR